MWSLILKYQISFAINGHNSSDDKTSLKQALLAWITSKIPKEIPMSNFTTDWSDGRAITALVNAVEPGLLPDGHVDPRKAKENTKKAIDAAEKHLEVPAVSNLVKNKRSMQYA